MTVLAAVAVLALLAVIAAWQATLPPPRPQYTPRHARTPGAGDERAAEFWRIVLTESSWHR